MKLPSISTTVVTPGNETITIVPDFQVEYNLTIHGAGVTVAILRALYTHGKFVSPQGFATRQMIEYITTTQSRSFTAFNISQSLKTLDKAGCIDREVRGRRTLSISLDTKEVPHRWYERFLVGTVGPQPIVEVIEETTPDPLPDTKLTDAIHQAIALLRAAVGDTATDQGTENQRLRELTTSVIAENERLSAELNRFSVEQRASVASSNHTSHDARAPLSLRSLGVRDTRMKRLIKHAYDHGFDVSKTNGEHIRFVPPNPAFQIVVSSSTPSDYRSNNNLHARLVRSGMPKLNGF